MTRMAWLLAIAACSGTAPPPAQRVAAPPPVVIDAAVPDAALDQDLPRLVERSLAMYRDVVAALAAGGSDCAAAAARLRELAGAHRDVVVANAKVVRDGRSEQLRTALAPHGDAFDAAARDVMQSPTMARCANEPAFTRAFDELFSQPS